MARDPGPDFRWGVLSRRSAFNRVTNGDGEIVLFEESTRRQELAVVHHIKAHNMGMIAATYTDIASAYDERAKRPDYENALADLQAGRIDGIAVWKVDRLVRRVTQYRTVLDVLEQSGGRLFTLVEGIDTADPKRTFVNGLILDLLVRLAEMESENTGVRVALAHEDRARKGLIHHSRLRPFGHTGDWFGLVLPEVKLLHEAAERLDAGEAAFSIAADWTAREIPTTAGRTRWHSDVLRRILLSPRMVGKREYGGTLFDLEGVPPIFDEETWQRVHDALAKRRNHTARVVVHLLSNIALCGNCDRTVLTNTPGKGRGFTYVCRPHFEGDSDACGKVSVVGALAEGRVREEVVAFLADKERVTALLRRHAGGPELDALHDRINVLSESLVALGKALNPPPGVPRMPLPVYYQQATAIEEERGELKRRLAVTREAALLAEVLTSGNPAKEWDARSLEWKRTILNLTTESIVIEPRGKGSVIPGRNAFDPERVKIKFAA